MFYTLAPMNLSEWAARVGVSKFTAYRWFREGTLPVPAQRVGRLILVQTEAGTQHPGHRLGQHFTPFAAKPLSATDVIGKSPSQG